LLFVFFALLLIEALTGVARVFDLLAVVLRSVRDLVAFRRSRRVRELAEVGGCRGDDPADAIRDPAHRGPQSAEARLLENERGEVAEGAPCFAAQVARRSRFDRE